MAKLFLLLAAVNGFLSVSLGAFAAHGLRERLSPELLATFQTGVQYHMYHALALLGIGILAVQYPAAGTLRVGGWLFLAGMVLFSGSLYLLAYTGIRWLGAITPFGGLAFLAGWFALGWFVLQTDFSELR
ncbi:MAG: DUF423 domain-containing protein [Pseudohongiellaceae bacterium]